MTDFSWQPVALCEYGVMIISFLWKEMDAKYRYYSDKTVPGQVLYTKDRCI